MIKEFNEHVSLVNNNDITSNNLQDTVNNDPTKISWSGDLKKKLLKGEYYNQEYGNTLISTYRPFVKEWVYFSNLFNNSIYLLPILFPEPNIDNLVITIQAPGGTKDFSVLMVDNIPDLHLVGDTQAFPFYIYKTDKGSLFKEENLDNGSYITAPSGEHYICQKNVTDWALNEYRKRYGLDVTKEDIFYYVYGLLHSPDYRERYKHNLKRTLPHIPFVTSTEDFRSFSDAGRRLAELHLYYENLPLFDQIEEEIKGDPDDPETYEVNKIRFGKKDKKNDKSVIVYNDKIKLKNIPLEVYEYQVGGKSPIEWVIDRYQVKKDKKSGIVNDPNKWLEEHDDPRYIVDLIKRLVTLSLETQRIVNQLPDLDIDESN